jgi:hypothetical protein
LSEQDTYIDLFDQYLKGEIHGAELASFEKRLSGDQAFAEALRVHSILVSGIREHGRMELKNYLKEHGKMAITKAPVRRFDMRYAAAASIVVLTILGVATYFYVQPQHAPIIATISEKQEEPIVLDSARAIAPPELAEKYAEHEKQLEVPEKQEEIHATWADMAAAGEGSIQQGPVVESAPPGEFENKVLDLKQDDGIAVLSEKKLKDTVVKAPVLFVLVETKDLLANEVAANRQYRKYSVDQSSPKIPGTFNNNMNTNAGNAKSNTKEAKDTVQFAYKDINKGKKNEDLKKDEDPSKKDLNIEFWQSPVHFRGYKYTGNTILLYSVPQASARIFIVNNMTYLRTEGIVYVLDPCPNACEFKPETDNTIINFIIQQP